MKLEDRVVIKNHVNPKRFRGLIGKITQFNSRGYWVVFPKETVEKHKLISDVFSFDKTEVEPLTKLHKALM